MTNSADPDQLASDLDLHCLLGQGMTCLVREGLILCEVVSLSFLNICKETPYNYQLPAYEIGSSKAKDLGTEFSMYCILLYMT